MNVQQELEDPFMEQCRVGNAEYVMDRMGDARRRPTQLQMRIGFLLACTSNNGLEVARILFEHCSNVWQMEGLRLAYLNNANEVMEFLLAQYVARTWAIYQAERNGDLNAFNRFIQHHQVTHADVENIYIGDNPNIFRESIPRYINAFDYTQLLRETIVARAYRITLSLVETYMARPNFRRIVTPLIEDPSIPPMFELYFSSFVNENMVRREQALRLIRLAFRNIQPPNGYILSEEFLGVIGRIYNPVITEMIRNFFERYARDENERNVQRNVERLNQLPNPPEQPENRNQEDLIREVIQARNNQEYEDLINRARVLANRPIPPPNPPLAENSESQRRQQVRDELKQREEKKEEIIAERRREAQLQQERDAERLSRRSSAGVKDYNLYCTNNTNVDGVEFKRDDDVVVISDENFNFECYLLRDLLDSIDFNDTPMTVWTQKCGIDAQRQCISYTAPQRGSEPIVKLFMYNKWLTPESSKLLLASNKRFFLLRKTELKPIGTQYGSSRLHGSQEMLHELIPIVMEEALNNRLVLDLTPVVYEIQSLRNLYNQR